MKRKIVSISFLYEDERVRIGADAKGRFPLPKVNKNRPRNAPIHYMHPYTAKEFVEHKKVRHGDPVLTLSDGTKLRVYLNGDPTGAVVEALSVIEKHDKSCDIRTRLLRSTKKKSKKPSSSRSQGSFLDYDYGLDYYGYDDDSD